MSGSSSNVGYMKFNDSTNNPSEEVKGSNVIIQQPGYTNPQQHGYVNPMAQQPGFVYPMVQQPGFVNPQGGAAIVAQNWMPMPIERNPNCPPGLEYLTMIDQLLVHQKVELLEALTGFETQNQYTVKNVLGQTVFSAQELSDCCARQCCGSRRAFDMTICDNYGTEVIHLNRPLNCSGCCFPCCLQTMEVTSPPGTVIGFIHEEWSIFTHKYKLMDAAENVIFRIEKSICSCHCCGDIDFKVMTPDCKQQVGTITKQWSGLVKEAFTDADNFSVTFPKDLDVKMKAVMLGACFFIDFMHFENNDRKNNNESSGLGGLLMCLLNCQD